MNSTQYLGGYDCVDAYADQMNAIINGCRPQLKQNRHPSCGGDYLVDLSASNQIYVNRNVARLPFNTSCTYRAYSSCGYPVANMVTSGAITSDFDIAYATLDGVALDDEINGWNFTLNTQW